MAHALGTPRGARLMTRTTRSIVCLAYVLTLSAAFWAGAVWLASFLFRLGSLPH